MDSFKQIQSFVEVVTRGSLSAAARAEGVTPAIIGRRMDALEQRLGVRLMVRTTRRINLTFEGAAFLEDCQRILNDLANAEAAVSLGGVKASGHIKVSAPAGFGRRHVAPVVQRFLGEHPEVSCTLDLADRVVDLINEGFDCAVRIGEMTDSSLASLRLAEMRRVVVASPVYIARCGRPGVPEDLAGHDCLSLSQQRGWLLRDPEQPDVVQTYKLSGRFECNDGAVLHDWVLAGLGLAWRSMWEVGEDLAAGRLVSVLDEYAAPKVGIYVVFPERRRLPLRVRLLLDALKQAFAEPGLWS
ncbi:MAG: LysR family transcriptional regulator [Rhodocyclaceae bacterium]|jgi:DNA-binding transcriptional LysR family regulator|nr:LysR family transcriptional regulator [Rhodocyclaceae bacterium]